MLYDWAKAFEARGDATSLYNIIVKYFTFLWQGWLCDRKNS